MNDLFALIPVKHAGQGKSRLSGILEENERRALNICMAKRTLEVSAAHFGPSRIVVVTNSAEMAELSALHGARVLLEPPAQQGLNAALAQAARFAAKAGAQGIVVIPTDLVLISEDALASALGAMPASPGCVIVPDRRNTGTNMLAMTPGNLDSFCFGDHSLEHHAYRAKSLGYRVHIHRCDVLGLDLDVPEDYRDWLVRREPDCQKPPSCVSTLLRSFHP